MINNATKLRKSLVSYQESGLFSLFNVELEEKIIKLWRIVWTLREKAVLLRRKK